MLLSDIVKPHLPSDLQSGPYVEFVVESARAFTINMKKGYPRAPGGGTIEFVMGQKAFSELRADIENGRQKNIDATGIHFAERALEALQEEFPSFVTADIVVRID